MVLLRTGWRWKVHVGASKHVVNGTMRNHRTQEPQLNGEYKMKGTWHNKTNKWGSWGLAGGITIDGLADMIRDLKIAQARTNGRNFLDCQHELTGKCIWCDSLDLHWRDCMNFQSVVWRDIVYFVDIESIRFLSKRQWPINTRHGWIHSSSISHFVPINTSFLWH